MKVADDQVRVAVNVMRARLTVIGFNIAIVSFQIANLYRSSGGLEVPGVDHAVHVGPSMALFMALGLSLIALVAYIMSSAAHLTDGQERISDRGHLDEAAPCRAFNQQLQLALPFAGDRRGPGTSSGVAHSRY